MINNYNIPGYSWAVIGSSGNLTNAAIRSDGLLFVWGDNTVGQLGLNDLVNRSFPVQLGTGSWSQVSANAFNIFAIDNIGRLFGIGDNTNGALGLNNTVHRSSPVQIGTSSWSSVSAGYSFTLAIQNDGLLFTWGLGTNGQLGTNSTGSRSSPTQIGTSSWTVISGGFNHSTGITVDRGLFAWGLGTNGQLGNNVITSRSSPTQIGTSSWTSVSAGYSHTVGLSIDRLLYTWGNNTNGQLGILNVLGRSSPTQVGSSSWTIVTAGNNITAGITINNNLFTWGNGLAGALGLNDLISRSSPVQVGTSNSWTLVSSSIDNTLGVWNNQLLAWGGNGYGQLGDNSITVRSNPTVVNSTNVTAPARISTSSWNSVSAGYSHNLAIASNNLLFGWGDYAGTSFNKYTYIRYLTGSIGNSGYLRNDYALFLYGVNNNGQIGDNTVATKSSPTQIGTSSWTVVSLMPDRTMAITSVGALFGWGQNTNGELGLSVATNRSSPTQVGTSSWSQVSTGIAHTAAIDVNSLLYAWGLGTTGQLGNNLAASRSSPTQIGTSSWTQVAVSSSNTYAISRAALFAWGLNTNGQIGDGTTVTKSSPVQIGLIASDTDETTYAAFSGQQLLSWSQVSSGASHSLAIKSDGSLWTWGNNAAGQLGTSDIISVSSPVKLGTGSWSSVSAGASHSLAIANNGLLYTWGLNNAGQIGLTDIINRSSPTQIGTNSFTVISAGASHTTAIQSTGALFTWGLNAAGQLGTVDVISRSSPTQIGTSSYSLVSAGVSHTMVAASYVGLSPGLLYTFGNNTTGTLGDNSVVSKSSPVQITTITSEAVQLSYLQTTGLTTYSWSQLSQGSSHTMAIRSDGLLFGWGLNTSGQLGNGNFNNVSIPTQIGTSSWSQISAGAAHTLGLTANNTLFAWGLNSSGQLGNAQLVNQQNPFPIGFNATAGYYSGYFGIDFAAAGLYNITAPSSTGNDLGGNTWTLECWVYTTATGNNIFISCGVGGISGYYWFGINSSNFAQHAVATPVGAWGFITQLTSTSTIPNNTWTHIAWVRTSSTGMTVYLNGIASGSTTTYTSSGSPPGTQTFFIGSYFSNNNSDGSLFRGYISNLRIVKNTTVYTGNFSVPTSPLTAIANTSLLILQDSTFVDNSGTGNFPTWTRNGAVATTSINPFGFTGSFVTSWTQISAGASHSLGVTSTRALFAWGAGSSGQLGTNTAVVRSSPTQVGTSSWSSVSAGTDFSLGILTNKTLYTWGLNTSGQMGDFTAVTKSSPVQIGTSSWNTISAGGTHSVALDSNNVLYGWGLNTSGQLGDGDLISKSSPVQITTLFGNSAITSYATLVGQPYSLSWTQIAAGQSYYLGITQDGSLYGWGSNNIGQLGTNDILNRMSPTRIGNSSWSQVSVNTSSTVAIRTDGAIFAWGQNTAGQLGTLDIINRSSPTQIGTGSWSSVSAGASFIQGITSTGLLFAWGLGTSGQLGNNVITSRSSPTQIGTSSWSSVSAGGTHALGILTDNTLYAWGLGTSGQLGLNVATSRSSPTQVGTSSWTSVSAGQTHSAAINSNSNLFTWGFNTSGQMGDSTLVTKSSPTQIGSNTWSFIEAGVDFNTGIDTTNILYTWGLGTSGQLGDTTLVTKSSPVLIGSIPTNGYYSNYFDGTTDFLTCVGSGAVVRTNGVFTIEGWYYPTSSAASFRAVYSSGTGYATAGRLYQNNTTLTFYWSPSFGTTGSIGWTLNTWNHFAVTWDGTTTKVYVNGQQTISSASPTYSGTTDLSIGESTYSPFGYISNFRVVGAVVYQTPFTPPTSPLTAIANTSLLTCQSSTFIDNSSNNFTITVNGNISISGLSPFINPSATPTINATAGNTIAGLIDSTNTLYTWGIGTSAELGNLRFSSQSSPTLVKSINDSWSVVSAGNAHTLGIRSDLPLYVFGSGTNGALGLNSVVNQSVPVVLPGVWSKIAIPQGTQLSGAVNNNGVLYTWGTNAAGALGNYNYNPPVGTNASSPVFVKSVNESYTVLSAGNNINGVIRRDGLLHTWGWNTNGQLGDGTAANKSNPIQIGSSSWSQIASGAVNMYGLTNNQLYAWGQNTIGQIGDGTVVSKSSPTQIGSSSWTFVESSTTNSYTMAIANNRKLYAWGVNTNGILGALTNLTTFSSPTLVPSILGSATSVVGGTASAFALRSDGRLFAWGSQGTTGMLGTNDIIPRSNPVQIGSSSWTALASGSQTETMYAINSNNLLYGWGSNTTGGLGQNDAIHRSSPVQVGTFKWTSIGVGNSGSVGTTQEITGVRNDGTLFAWGYTTYQPQLATVNRSSPTQVGTASSYVNGPIAVNSITQIGSGTYSGISAGNNYSLAYGTNNALYQWGASDTTATYYYASPTSVGYSATNVSAGISTVGFVRKS